MATLRFDPSSTCKTAITSAQFESPERRGLCRETGSLIQKHPQKGWENEFDLGMINFAVATCCDPADSIALKRAFIPKSLKGRDGFCSDHRRLLN
jgi:hypothetical protein